MNILTGCAKQIAPRNQGLTKDCIYPELTVKHKAPGARDELLIKRGEALSECTNRMRIIRKK